MSIIKLTLNLWFGCNIFRVETKAENLPWIAPLEKFHIKMSVLRAPAKSALGVWCRLAPSSTMEDEASSAGAWGRVGVSSVGLWPPVSLVAFSSDLFARPWLRDDSVTLH